MQQTTSAMLADRLRAEGAATLEYFQGLDRVLWGKDLYGGDEHWRLRDLLAHLIAAEQGFLELIQNVAAGGAGAPEGFDIDDYNRRTVDALRSLNVDVLLGQYAMVRERTAAVVAGLRDEQLENRGRHPHLGDTRLEEMIRLVYHHNSLHLRDVRRAIRAATVDEEAAA